MNDDVTPKTIDEPRGHGGRLSKIERVWSGLPAGYSLRMRRTERFDTVASLLYSPVEYIAEQLGSIHGVDEEPSLDWIATAFSGFVLGEFGSSTTRTAPEVWGPIRCNTDAGSEAPHQYLEHCEAELVYGGLRALTRLERRGIEESVYDILSTDILGNRVNRRYLDRDAFGASVAPSLDAQERLQFVLPAFPFKDQNPFRTEAPADHVDLADIALLVRLHSLALAMFQVHPFGADWIVLADGVAHSSSLGVDSEQAIAYRERLRDWRNTLNLQGTVTILDLDVVARHTDGDQHVGRFEAIVRLIGDSLRRLISRSTSVRESLEVLIRGMAWNLATRHYENRFSREEIWQAVVNLNRQAAPQSSLASDIRERSFEAAIHYAAYNLSLRWLKVIERVFPSAIRATVHPKPGQVAVPAMGSVYPWNGVAVVQSGTFRANDVTVAPWCDYHAKGKELIGHRERPDAPPLYYTFASDKT